MNFPKERSPGLPHQTKRGSRVEDEISSVLQVSVLEPAPLELLPLVTRGQEPQLGEMGTSKGCRPLRLKSTSREDLEDSRAQWEEQGRGGYLAARDLSDSPSSPPEQGYSWLPQMDVVKVQLNVQCLARVITRFSQTCPVCPVSSLSVSRPSVCPSPS